MLSTGVRDFSIHESEKSRPAPLFVMLTEVVAIIPEGGLAPSLYRVEIEHEQLEHLNTVNKIGDSQKLCVFLILL